MTQKKLDRQGRPVSFTRAIERELLDHQRKTVAIMVLSLECPKTLFGHAHARFIRETVALLPSYAPAFKAVDIQSDRIFAVLHGEVSELMDLVNDTHLSVVVLEAKYPESLKFCMSLTVAKNADTVDSLMNRTDAMLTDAMLEFS